MVEYCEELVETPNKFQRNCQRCPAYGLAWICHVCRGNQNFRTYVAFAHPLNPTSQDYPKNTVRGRVCLGLRLDWDLNSTKETSDIYVKPRSFHTSFLSSKYQSISRTFRNFHKFPLNSACSITGCMQRVNWTLNFVIFSWLDVVWLPAQMECMKIISVLQKDLRMHRYYIYCLGIFRIIIAPYSLYFIKKCFVAKLLVNGTVQVDRSCSYYRLVFVHVLHYQQVHSESYILGENKKANG